LRTGVDPSGSAPVLVVRPAWVFAWRWKSSGGEGGVTPSQEQLRHREVGWEGSFRQILAPRNTNRIRHAGRGKAATDVEARSTIERSVCKCGGGQGKVNVLIRGGLFQCDVRLRVGRPCFKGGADGAGVSRRHSTDGNISGWEGLNARN